MTTDFYTVKANGIRSTIDEFEVMPEMNKTGSITGFDTFINTANQIEAEAKDFRVIGNDIQPFVGDDGLIRVNIGGKNGETYNITDWSLSQLSQKLGVPANYAVKMADAGKRNLFVQNFQSWIDSHHAGKYFLIRTHGDTIRGVLSDSYHATDTGIILPLMQEGLQSTNMNFNVHKGIINPEYANIRIVADRQVQVGNDPHFMGVSLSTSDVGRASIKMDFFVYRSACTNGMLFGKHGGTLFQKKHTSRHLAEPGNFENEVRKSLSNLDNLIVYAEDVLKESSVYKLKQGEMERIVNEYRAFASIGARETEAITESLKDFMPIYNNIDQTLWSVSNAFTEMAQLHTLDKAEKMENFAGHLLHKRLHG